MSAVNNAGIILQARLSSKRFPNKVITPLLGKPVIQWCIEEIVKTGLPWVVAMPNNKTDLGLREWLKLYSDKTGIKIRTGTGSMEDLILRFNQVNQVTNFDPIIRLCADSPFFTRRDIELALKIYEERGYYTMINHVQVFSKKELEYQDNNDPFVESRQHAGTRGMAHTVDFAEDIYKLETEFNNNSPTMHARMKFRNDNI